MKLKQITQPNSIITAIDHNERFPELLDALQKKYESDIQTFRQLIEESSSSAELLEFIRHRNFESKLRMSLLKMFRRCVSPILDTETTKKIKKVSTQDLIDSYGATFKDIKELKQQFSNLSNDRKAALAALIGEYDTRGQVGYALTKMFFVWFKDNLGSSFTIEGPVGAGKDIELSSIFNDFEGSFPCDFVIYRKRDVKLLAVGFARYDSTRGGAQSDDRTAGNSDKVNKAKRYCEASGTKLKMIFLADGPGLAHKDTWEEACQLDELWDGNVRVVTLKTCEGRLTAKWLTSS